jgi:hypothetical protein
MLMNSSTSASNDRIPSAAGAAIEHAGAPDVPGREVVAGPTLVCVLDALAALDGALGG